MSEDIYFETLYNSGQLRKWGLIAALVRLRHEVLLHDYPDFRMTVLGFEIKLPQTFKKAEKAEIIEPLDSCAYSPLSMEYRVTVENKINELISVINKMRKNGN